MRLIPFTTDRSERWDRLVDAAPMGTFLHSRRFLSYHGERFLDVSLLVGDESDVPRAAFPAAVDGDDPRRVVSHPGATYGGLVHEGLYAPEVRDMVRGLCVHYAERGFEVLRYKPVPYIFHLSPSADDVWALGALGARKVRSGLSCTIDVAARRPPTTRRVRSLKKARRAGVEVSDDPAHFTAFWPLLESVLERRYGKAPVHTLDEIELLRERFPTAIRLVTGHIAGEAVAGVVLFATERVFHVQYMASDQAGMRASALDAVVERCIETAIEAGARYFDFGTSMREDGDDLEPGLQRFKAEFGGGGVLFEWYDLDLRRVTEDR
jgi:hypothetical protein